MDMVWFTLVFASFGSVCDAYLPLGFVWVCQLS